MHTVSESVSTPRAEGIAKTARLALVGGALGVVFGDIGTSPIYTIQTLFNPDDPHPVPISTQNVYGIVSLIFWSVMIIVTLTYVTLVMRADNNGEGGIMALITLVLRLGGRGRTAVALATLGIFGAALFFGDSMITPAISVLSAVEGVKVVEPRLDEWIVPMTAVIIVALFAVQRRGTAAVGRLFGPVMIAWFVAIGACGVRGIVGHPEILKALSPTYALEFMVGHFHIAFFALAAVVLAFTGAEALYADMGHFGRSGDYLGLAGSRVAGMHAQLFWSGGIVARRRGHGERPVLSTHSGLGAIADGATGHRRNDHRLPGGDHWGLFSGISGRSARLLAEAANTAHLGVEDRPDLRAMDQLAADGGGAHPGVRVPQLGGAVIRLRHGGNGHDHHHHAAVPIRGPEKMAGPAVARRDRRRRIAIR